MTIFRSYITAVQVCQLLDKLAALNLGVPLSVILDNARWSALKLLKRKSWN
jgi:hypothetical protein